MVKSSINEREGYRKTDMNATREDNRCSGLLLCASKQRPLQSGSGYEEQERELPHTPSGPGELETWMKKTTTREVCNGSRSLGDCQVFRKIKIDVN